MIQPATLAKYLFYCFSTGDSAHQASREGFGGTDKPQFMREGRDLPRDMGACATAGNQLAQEEPILDAGAEQAQQMPAAEPGTPRSQNAYWLLKEKTRTERKETHTNHNL